MLCQTLKLTDKLPQSLSKLCRGEWQRVRIAGGCLQIWSSLNPQATLLLLDEPMNCLDVAQQVTVDRLLQDLIEAGLSIILSTHDLNHTLQRAQQVWMLKNGAMLQQGKTWGVISSENLSNLFEVNFTLLHIVLNTGWLLKINHSVKVSC